MNARSIRLTSAALTGLLALAPLLASAASADPHGKRGRGNGRWRNERTWQRDRGQRVFRGDVRYRSPRYVVVRRPRAVVLRPSRVDVFVVRRPRFVVARPVPIWLAPSSGVSGRVGIHTRRLNVDFSFSKQRPYYGCGFCDDYYSSYGQWESHVQHCGARPSGRVLCEQWDEDQFQACQDEAGQAWSRGDDDGDRGYRDDRRYDDRRYDDDDDRYYNEDDDR
jgi:hypothetical protein